MVNAHTRWDKDNKYERNMNKILPVLCLAAFGLSCSYGLPTEEKIPLGEGEISLYRIEGQTGLDIQTVASAIDRRRASAEQACDTILPVVILPDQLGRKLSRRCDKVHIYARDGWVTRMKAYPPSEDDIPSREFYFHENQLELVVVEYDADIGRGKPLSELDRIIYLHQGELVLEMGRQQNGDRNDEHTDLQDLQDEAATYLQFHLKQGTTVPS